MTTQVVSLAMLSLLAQSPETTRPRPKIGLVLEGGGALGFAHIGVLQWFEDHHIPVDYIAGTSMGGLVGGLYATGKQPDEIRSLARNINWDKTLSGVPALPDLGYRRKEDNIDFPNRLSFGLKGGVSVPGGLNGGQEIGLILDRAVLPYFDLKSFDDLPIPFRCVATEMLSGTQTIFDRGSLALALRATMSIPAVFAPVKDGNKMYTDGGALNNLPVDVAKQMGADIVIAVYLDQGASDPKTFESLLGAAGRNISIMIAANEIRSMQQADILLAADVKGYTAADFSKSEAIVPKGIDAANKKSALLERFALNESDWQAHLAARAAKRRSRVPAPSFISVTGASREVQKSVKAELTGRVNKPLDPDKIDAELHRLAGIGYFESLGYNIARQNGAEGLQIRAVEKSYGPPFLNLGVNVDGSDTNDIRFGISARVTLMDLGGFRSELRFDGSFGPQNGIRAEYFHPLTPFSRWFFAPRLYAFQRPFDVYVNQRRAAEYDIHDAGLGGDLGYSISRKAELRFGEALDWESGKLVIGQQLAPNGSNRRSISSVRFNYFGQDDAVVPRRGTLLQSEYLYNSNGMARKSSGYSSATTKLSHFLPVSDKGSLFVQAFGGSTFGAKGLGGDSFALGGPLSLGAYGKNELLGNQFYLFHGGYLHELFRLNPLIGSELYAVGFYEIGKVYAPLLPGTPRNPMDATGAIVVKTALGPVFLGGSVGEGWNRKWYFGLGRVF